MINQLQFHLVVTLWAKQRIFAEAVEETLPKRPGWQNPVASGIDRRHGGDDLGKAFSGYLVTHIAVESVITDSLETFWQDVLDHSSHELEFREGFMLDLFCFVVLIPVADRFAVIVFDSSYRDGGRNDIFRQVLSQSLSAGRNFSRLKECYKAFGILFPCSFNVLFHSRIVNLFSEHFQEMVLPLFVHHFVRNVGDVFPMFQRINSAAGHEDVKMGVVMAGSSGGLENNNGSNVEFFSRISVENVFEAGVSRLHQGAEQCGIAIKPDMQGFGHSQNHMAISNAGQETPSDEISPAVGIDRAARQAKAGFAGEGNSANFSALAASVLSITHLFGIAAVKHFPHSVIAVGIIKAPSKLLKGVPVIIENPFERVSVNILESFGSHPKKLVEISRLSM